MATTTVFQLLGEPSRQAIVELLLEGERPVGELVAILDQSQPAVSKQLRLLREAGLVACRSEGRRRLYRLRPERLAEVDDWLAPYRELWATSLDRLEQHLDEKRTR